MDAGRFSSRGDCWGVVKKEIRLEGVRFGVDCCVSVAFSGSFGSTSSVGDGDGEGSFDAECSVVDV